MNEGHVTLFGSVLCHYLEIIQVPIQVNAFCGSNCSWPIPLASVLPSGIHISPCRGHGVSLLLFRRWSSWLPSKLYWKGSFMNVFKDFRNYSTFMNCTPPPGSCKAEGDDSGVLLPWFLEGVPFLQALNIELDSECRSLPSPKKAHCRGACRSVISGAN